jgi:hypothetical protein
MRRNLRTPPKPEELQREISKLERRMTLWSNPEFQEQFVKPLEVDLERLEKAQWVLTNEELTLILREIGVQGPQEASDLLTLFLCARSVVASWQKRLRPFREAEEKLSSLKKELS